MKCFNFNCKMEKDPSVKINMRIAKNYMTVAILIETMETLNCLSEEWQERKKYCLFKVGHITKCINEGKEPKRGNPFSEKDLKKKEHSLIPAAEDEVPDEGDMTAKHVRTNKAFVSKPGKDESEDEEEHDDKKSKSKYPNINQIHDYYLNSFANAPSSQSTFSGNSANSMYPQISEPPSNLMPNFLSSSGMGGSRRIASKTIVSHISDKSKLKSSKINDRELNEIQDRIKAGISNLSYYKVDLAIKELEEAVDLLKSVKNN